MALTTFIFCCLVLTLTRGQHDDPRLSAANSESEETPAEDQGLVEDADVLSKRGWSDLGSAWGKRDWNKLQGMWGKRSWSSFNHGWGKRDFNPRQLSAMPDTDADREKKTWSNLRNAWGKRTLSDDQDDLEFDAAMQKRAWNSLQGSWGKRDGLNMYDGGSTYIWDGLKSAWKKRRQIVTGNELARKRQPGWNNLKGLWG